MLYWAIIFSCKIKKINFLGVISCNKSGNNFLDFIY
jgi:hypothetical protein